MKKSSVAVSFIIFLIISFIFSVGSPSPEPKVFTSVKGRSIDDIMEKGRRMYKENKRDSALLLFSIVASQYSDKMSPMDKDLAVRAMNNVGIIYQNYHLNYIQAYNYFSDALRIANEEDMTDVEAIIYLNLAELFKIYAQNNSTEVFVSKIYDLVENGFEKAWKAKDYPCMAGILMNQLLYDLSTPTQKFEKIFSPEISDTLMNVRFTRHLMKAANLYQQKKYSDTREVLKDSYRLIDSEWNPEHYHITVTNSIGDTYLAEGNIVKANEWYKRSLALADSVRIVDLQLMMLSKLSRNDPVGGSDYRLIYLEKKDSIMSKGRLAMVGELDFLRDLTLEKERNEKLASKRRALITWISIMGGVLVIIVTLFILYVKQTKKLKVSNLALYRHINASLREEKPVLPVSGDKESPNAEEVVEAAKYSSSSLSEEKIEDIFEKIQKELSNPQYISSTSFSLANLASSINVNTSYVSRVINEKYGCSFSALVTDRRIKLACQRLSDTKNYGNMTIEAIAESVGFQSRSSFVKAFKKINGITPSEYMKMSRENA